MAQIIETQIQQDMRIRGLDGVIPTSGIDVTGYSVRERTRNLISEQPGAIDALASFRTENPNNNDRVVILLPGIVPSSDITFFKQKQFLTSSGFEVVSVDYSTKTHSDEVLRAQLGDFLDIEQMTNRDVSFVALSFGATCVLDFLTESQQQNAQNVKKVAFIGPLHSLNDIDDPLVGKAIRLSHKLTPSSLQKSFMPFVKKAFRMDPQYVQEFGEEYVYRDLAQMSSTALVERLRTLAQATPVGQLRRQDNVDALFIGWEKDYSSAESQTEYMNLFAESRYVTVPGRHGFTSTSSSEINQELGTFLRAN